MERYELRQVAFASVGGADFVASLADLSAHYTDRLGVDATPPFALVNTPEHCSPYL